MLSPTPPCAARIPLAPVPGQRALSGKRMRTKPAPDDAELLALGRLWEASAARERALDDQFQEIADVEPLGSSAYEAARGAVLNEAEIGAQLRRRIVSIRATTWPGMMLKIALTTWAYDVGDEEFAEVLKKDKHVTGEALTMSLSRDLRTWFGRPDPDAELLVLGAQFENAWREENELRERADATYDNEIGELWDVANDATKVVVEQIEKLPARTLAGLVIKARACSWCHGGEPIDEHFFSDHATLDERLGASILYDLLALDGHPLPTAERAPEAKAA